MTIHVLISLLPVLIFLFGLYSMDSFKLVTAKRIGIWALWGVISALVAFQFHAYLLSTHLVSQTDLIRYIAPFTEEAVKSAIVVYFVRKRHIGFSIDALIMGFSIGAGFATAENIYYLLSAEGDSIIWIIRGFGPAILHGLCTGIVAVTMYQLSQLRSFSIYFVWPLAILAAFVLHSVYNHFILTPIWSTLALVVFAPILLSFLFKQSEVGVRQWLGSGFDLDQEMLVALDSATFPQTRLGLYLSDLTGRVDPLTVVDMLCLIRIRTELAIRAKGVMMLKEAGIEPTIAPEIKRQFQEMDHLEKNIGKMGLLAINALSRWEDRDLWHLNQLDQVTV